MNWCLNSYTVSVVTWLKCYTVSGYTDYYSIVCHCSTQNFLFSVEDASLSLNIIEFHCKIFTPEDRAARPRGQRSAGSGSLSSRKRRRQRHWPGHHHVPKVPWVDPVLSRESLNSKQRPENFRECCLNHLITMLTSVKHCHGNMIESSIAMEKWNNLLLV